MNEGHIILLGVFLAGAAAFFGLRAADIIYAQRDCVCEEGK